MRITAKAKTKLAALLPGDCCGFRFEGVVGSCRGSTPILKPIRTPEPGSVLVECEGLVFYCFPEQADCLQDGTLDYDPSMFGRGLNLTWPHRESCQCQR